ncbi:hypothetical protein DFH08DRAFT_964606 [Mycena albidolilacea]|uniref:Uncharacterized protein n=1 Tax=Mycena albidolilacea TaxID=1033008 RepID=A0AAD6ZT69_9AGAR|nr:hypothetical protein DFH08DRAFT_964606 [Mycena albidolilacea]
MAFIPPWSSYMLTSRRKVVPLKCDLVELAVDQLNLVDGHQFLERTWRSLSSVSVLEDDADSAIETDSSTSDSDNASDSPSDTDSDAMRVVPDGEEEYLTPVKTPVKNSVRDVVMFNSESNSYSNDDDDNELDTDYMLPTLLPPHRPYERFDSPLRPRAHPSLLDLLGLCPVPNILPRAHLRSLGFREIKWDDPHAFLDLHSCIGAFFVGPPAERTTWEQTIIEATNNMNMAQAFFERRVGDDATLQGGITCDADLGAHAISPILMTTSKSSPTCDI